MPASVHIHVAAMGIAKLARSITAGKVQGHIAEKTIMAKMRKKDSAGTRGQEPPRQRPVKVLWVSIPGQGPLRPGVPLTQQAALPGYSRF